MRRPARPVASRVLDVGAAQPGREQQRVARDRASGPRTSVIAPEAGAGRLLVPVHRVLPARSALNQWCGVPAMKLSGSARSTSPSAHGSVQDVSVGAGLNMFAIARASRCRGRVQSTMSPAPRLVEREGHVLVVTMNRPERKNALSPEMLCAHVRRLARCIDADADVRCAILTGAGGTFCAGADLKAMAAGRSQGEREWQQRFDAGARPAWKALLRHNRLKKPLIAAVEGYAVAGGTEILQATDIRVAARDGDLRRDRGDARPVPARRLDGAPAPADPVHAGGRDPADRPPRERAGGEGDRPRSAASCPTAQALAEGARDRRSRSARTARSRCRRCCSRCARPRACPRPTRSKLELADRLADLRHRGREGGPARLRGEAQAELQGKVTRGRDEPARADLRPGGGARDRPRPRGAPARLLRGDRGPLREGPRGPVSRRPRAPLLADQPAHGALQRESRWRSTSAGPWRRCCPRRPGARPSASPAACSRAGSPSSTWRCTRARRAIRRSSTGGS